MSERRRASAPRPMRARRAHSGPSSAHRCGRSAGYPGSTGPPRPLQPPRARARQAGGGSGTGPGAPHCGTCPSGRGGGPRGTGPARLPPFLPAHRDRQTPRGPRGRPRAGSSRATPACAGHWCRCSPRAHRWCPRPLATAGPARPPPSQGDPGTGSTGAAQRNQTAPRSRARGPRRLTLARGAPALRGCPHGGAPGRCGAPDRASSGPASGVAAQRAQIVR
mmetsp:Transcript_104455/g.311909  ORF Transcript_104455/g.311909 Transcript_104455/m.311909 type:complete len:221 (-) Transcript_104455:96-758(-)